MFISPAFAADVAATPGAAENPGILVTVAPLILIFFVFYVMVIRPQNKRITEHRKMIDQLQKGDKVVTGGGIIATVKKVQGEDEIVLDIGGGVEVTAVRQTIMLIRDAKAMKKDAA